MSYAHQGLPCRTHLQASLRDVQQKSPTAKAEGLLSSSGAERREVETF